MESGRAVIVNLPLCMNKDCLLMWVDQLPANLLYYIYARAREGPETFTNEYPIGLGPMVWTWKSGQWTP